MKTRLALPGGGYFDLPMPNDTYVSPPSRSLAAATPSSDGSVLVPVLIGGALGALLTWGAIKLFR